MYALVERAVYQRFLQQYIIYNITVWKTDTYGRWTKKLGQKWQLFKFKFGKFAPFNSGLLTNRLTMVGWHKTKMPRVTVTNISLASKTVFLLTFSSLAIARMIMPSPRCCLIRCFWNSVRFGITADKITVNSDCKSQFYFDFILTIKSLIQM
jgi:hypothetical protein